MNQKTIINLLESIKNWQISPKEAINFINDFYDDDENLVDQIIKQRDGY